MSTPPTTSAQPLADKVRAGIAAASAVITNSFLTLVLSIVEAIEARAATDAVLESYVDDLDRRASQPHFATRPLATNEFLRVLGEAYFYLCATERGIALERVPETHAGRRPDFSYEIQGQKVYFEVKTPSIVDGDAGVLKALMESMHAKLSLEEQQRAGRHITSAVAGVQPFGAALHQNGLVRGPIQVLIEKFRQNLKTEQYKLGPTFLVLNLAAFPFADATRNLRPVFAGHYPTPMLVSGRSWTLAFGTVGQLIHGMPEFKGRPAIDGTLDKEGILTSCPYIRGLVVLNKPWRTGAHLGVLMRAEDAGDEPWQTLIHQLAGSTWNDQLDSNGFALDVDDPE